MREDMDEKMDAAADVQESTEGGGKKKLDVTLYGTPLSQADRRNVVAYCRKHRGVYHRQSDAAESLPEKAVPVSGQGGQSVLAGEGGKAGGEEGEEVRQVNLSELRESQRGLRGLSGNEKRADSDYKAYGGSRLFTRGDHRGADGAAGPVFQGRVTGRRADRQVNCQADCQVN